MRGQDWGADIRAYDDIIIALGFLRDDTEYDDLLERDPRAVARRLLHPLGETPEGLGWDGEVIT